MEDYSTSSNLVSQQAYLMFSTKSFPFQKDSTMHMDHVFKNTFKDVVSAFMLKYNGSNKFCTTTICHVE